MLEVFSSFDCPHCKIFHEEIAPRLMNDYVLRGKVCLVSREFPLPASAGHPYAHDVAVTPPRRRASASTSRWPTPCSAPKTVGR